MVAPGGVRGCFRGACMVAPRGECAWLLPGGACLVAPGGHAWLLWGACVVALGVCMVAPGGWHVWLLLGGVHGCCWGGMHACCQGVCMVAPGGGACVGYDKIRRYDQ